MKLIKIKSQCMTVMVISPAIKRPIVLICEIASFVLSLLELPKSALIFRNASGSVPNSYYAYTTRKRLHGLHGSAV